MSFILKIVFLFSLAPVVYWLRPVLFNRERKAGFYILVIVHALILSFAAISVLNLPATILSDEVSFLANKPVGKSKNEEAYKFINDNFLLVNNSFDKALIENPNETQGDSTYLAITNRKKLAELFNMLAEDSNNVDLVVCDIGFDDTTGYDGLLSDAMLRLYRQNKLLVSVAGKHCTNKALSFPDRICGDIKEETNEKLFTTHRLKRPEFFSLPYQVYTYLNNIHFKSSYCFNLFLQETGANGKNRFVMNTYLPQFFIKDEALLANGFTQAKQNILNVSDTDFVQSNTFLLRTLGNSVSETGKENLLDDIQQREHTGKKNIIVIGAFNGNEDVHRTAYAELHGPTILLNLIYSLQKNQNKISVLLILFLIFSFFIISLKLFNGLLQKSVEDKITLHPKLTKHLNKWRENQPFKKHKKNSHRTQKKANPNFASLFMRFIFSEESHYWLLVILIFLLYFLFGILINAISLAVYFIAFETFAVHFGKAYLKSKTFKENI